MSARKLSAQVVEIPQDAQLLEFDRSDGDTGRWPGNTIQVVDDAGEVNYMQPLGIDSAHAIRWRVAVAQGIAAATNMSANTSYALRDWPTGYALFDHQKGPVGNPRHDLYLFGAPSRRYRSINEFIPHAIWLYQDISMNPSNCLCKYCQKKPQKEVSASFVPGILRTAHTPTPSHPKPARSRGLRETALKSSHEKVFAAVQKVPLPAPLKSANVHHKATMLVDRNSDLRAASSKTSMKLRRLFRTGELLWCSLEPPIKGPDNVAIQFWPGLVDEVQLKTTPVPHENATATSLPADNEVNGSSLVEANEGQVLWDIHQHTNYRMQFLAVNHAFIIPDNKVLPYQAHVPPEELILALKAFPSERLNFDREVLSRFNPCAQGESSIFDDAVAPFAVAMQIGSTLSAYWCLTDEWTFEYRKPLVQAPSTPPLSSALTSGATSLSAAIAAATTHNSVSPNQIVTGPSSSTDYFPSISSANTELTSTDTQHPSAPVPGKAPVSTALSGLLVQTRFQGLWWGAERIWVDEFVRLKVTRRCIAPNGAKHIFPPSGPGNAARQLWLESQKDISDFGAGPRGVFMKLDGLFIVDATQYDGSTRKECRASGMLYELADIDWEDSNAAINDSPSTLFSSQSQPPTAGGSVVPLTFVPAPSPLHPHILPTPNLVKSTISSPVAQAPPQPTPSLSNSQLSQPVAPRYHLPEAPKGFTFRPILSEGHEVVISLSLVSGRYYPGILSHPLLEPTLKLALGNEAQLSDHSDMWALEGLSAGVHNSVDPVHYRASRKKMVEDADIISFRELELHKQHQLSSTDDNMDEDVDQLYLMDVD